MLVKESRADMSSSLKTHPTMMMMSFVCLQRRSHERTDQVFLVVWHCTVLKCELGKMEETQPHLGHDDNQTCFSLYF